MVEPIRLDDTTRIWTIELWRREDMYSERRTLMMYEGLYAP